MPYELELKATHRGQCWCAECATRRDLRKEVALMVFVGLTALVVLVLLFGGVAHAQVTAQTPASPPFISKLFDLALSPSGFGVLASVVAGLVALLGINTEVRRRRLALAAYHAFHVVEDLAAETEGPDALDKVAEGLKAVDAYMLANGWRAAKPGEQEVAKLTFTALNGAQQAAVKVQAAALDAAKGTPAPVVP